MKCLSSSFNYINFCSIYIYIVHFVVGWSLTEHNKQELNVSGFAEICETSKNILTASVCEASVGNDDLTSKLEKQTDVIVFVSLWLLVQYN